MKAQVTEGDSLALVAMHLAYYGKDWTNDENWRTPNKPVGSWYGVKVEDGRVVELNLPNNNIEANLPIDVSEQAFLVGFLLDMLFSDLQRFNQLLPIITRLYEIADTNPLTKLRKIDLSGNKLSGNLPIQVGSIGQLLYLDLSKNTLSGSIPDRIGNLKKLSYLNLSENSFSGSIPDKIGGATALKRMILFKNKLTGAIPNELGNLINLTYLDLQGNKLNGSLPANFYNLSSLDSLYLRGNELSGNITENISKLSKLRFIDLSANKFVGVIPSGFGMLNDLNSLVLHNNYFSGDVPASIGQLPNLSDLRLEQNELVNLPQLNNVKFQLTAYENKFTFEDFEVSLPLIKKSSVQKKYHPQAAFGESKEVWAPLGHPYTISFPCDGKYNTYRLFQEYNGNLVDSIDLGHSDTYTFPLVGWGDAGEYFVKVRNDSVPNLELISLRTVVHVAKQCVYDDSIALVALYNATDGPNWTRNDNWMTGPIDTWWGVTLSEDGCNVTRIDFRIDLNTGNNLNGPIPDEIGNLSSLYELALPNNQLTGKLPENLKNLSKLTYMLLSGNSLSGELPKWLGNYPLLFELSLSGNLFSGTIPAEISNLANLLSLGLEGRFSSGQLSGTIPQEFEKLSKLSFIDLGHNQLSGDISVLGNIKNLETILIPNNQFSGPINENFFQLSKLKSFDASNNQLSGTISASIGSLEQLEYLMVSGNQLSGSIPTEIGNLQKLKRIELRNNQFSGNIPTSMGNISNVEFLLLSFNQFTGAIPNSFSNLTMLKELDLDDNYFTDIPDLSFIDSLFGCQTNYLTFEDIELNISLINSTDVGFFYSPQRKFEHDTTIYIVEGNPIDLERWCGGSANHYRWWKDGVEITNDSSVLSFASLQLEDSGDYWVTVTSTIVPNLELTSEQIHLVVNENCMKADSLILVDFFNNTKGNSWINNENWLQGPVNSWWGISTSTCNVTAIQLPNNNLNGMIDASLANLEKLQKIILNQNNLNGSVPMEFEQLNELSIFNIEDNQLKGALPDLGKLKALNEVNVASNKFLFSDLDAASLNANKVSFTYAPQDTILSLLYDNVDEELLVIDDEHRRNHYQWYLNDEPLSDDRNPIAITESGTYYSAITNTDFPELTLYSDTIYIEHFNPDDLEIEPVNLVIIDGAHSPYFKVSGIEQYSNNHLVIFSQWGNKVHEQNSYNNDFDMSSLQEGTYYYVLNLSLPEGSLQIKNFIDLIKR